MFVRDVTEIAAIRQHDRHFARPIFADLQRWLNVPCDEKELQEIAAALLETTFPAAKGVRLLETTFCRYCQQQVKPAATFVPFRTVHLCRRATARRP